MSADPSAAAKHRCPACGFPVHNRAYPKCERCKRDLPADLVFSQQERERQWKEFQARRDTFELPSAGDAPGAFIGGIDP